jgi:caa(3)-type oxidase subunit IV
MSASTPHSHETEGAHHTNYVKVWAILLVLLAVSLAGPELGIRSVTLLTAFGIAVVKAYIVAKYFMHLNIERRFVVQLLTVCLGLMVLFFLATAPDVMKHWGMNWRNDSAKNANIPEVVHDEGGAAGHAGGAAEHHGGAAEHHGGAAEHHEGGAAGHEAAPAAHGVGE